MLEQNVLKLDHRTNKSVISVPTELPVPTTFDNEIQPINNICVTEMERTFKLWLRKEICNNSNNKNNSNPRNAKQQAWIKET